jgi:hypothetical protein
MSLKVVWVSSGMLLLQGKVTSENIEHIKCNRCVHNISKLAFVLEGHVDQQRHTVAAAR